MFIYIFNAALNAFLKYINGYGDVSGIPISYLKYIIEEFYI